MCACVSKLAKALKFVLFTASVAQYHKADSPIDRRSKYFCHYTSHYAHYCGDTLCNLYLTSKVNGTRILPGRLCFGPDIDSNVNISFIRSNIHSLKEYRSDYEIPQLILFVKTGNNQTVMQGTPSIASLLTKSHCWRSRVSRRGNLVGIKSKQLPMIFFKPRRSRYINCLR